MEHANTRMSLLKFLVAIAKNKSLLQNDELWDKYCRIGNVPDFTALNPDWYEVSPCFEALAIMIRNHCFELNEEH